MNWFEDEVSQHASQGDRCHYADQRDDDEDEERVRANVRVLRLAHADVEHPDARAEDVIDRLVGGDIPVTDDEGAIAPALALVEHLPLDLGRRRVPIARSPEVVRTFVEIRRSLKKSLPSR